jgi:predicted AAA+ superfamily ATPase
MEPHFKGKAIIIYGARQVGKTTLIYAVFMILKKAACLG